MTENNIFFFLRGAFTWLYRDRSAREIRSSENTESCGTNCGCGDGCRFD